VHVRDGCNGLSREKLTTILEPFRRALNDEAGASGQGPSPRAKGAVWQAEGRPRGKAGRGLGLVIARRAVEALGGAITADAVDNVGCHFCLTLPKSRH